MAMQEEGLTDRIIACAFHVHNTLGAGFQEKVYVGLLINFGESVTLRRKFELPEKPQQS